MRKVVSLGFILVICCAASGQGAGRRAIVWSGAVECGFRTAEIAADESISCGSIQTPRGHVSTINHNGLHMAVAFLEDDDFLIAATFLRNSTERPFGFDADLWGAAHFEMKEGFFSSQKPLLAETAVPSRDIVRGIKTGVLLDNSAETFMAGVAKTVEVKVVRRPDGTLVRREQIVDDLDAKREAVSRNEIRSDIAVDQQEKIRKNALTQKWLPGASSVRGLVYFRRVKNAGLVVFSFKILDTTYIFRLPRQT